MLIAVLSAALADPGQAAVVLLKSGGDPVIGRILTESPNQILIRQLLPDGTERERTILAADIDEVIVTVPPGRLAQLDHHKPTEYRELAEELHEKQRDPEAREAAIRLYLIAAYLDPRKLGRSALLGLIDLARTESERRKFRAMAYLLDTQHDRDVLQNDETLTDAAATPMDAQARGHILAALRSLRQGRWEDALREGRQAGLEQTLPQFGDLLAYQQFEQACNERKISTSVLKGILAIELSMSSRSADEIEVGVKADAPVSWQDSIARDGKSPIPALTLETITEFDPRKCQYRDGQWIVPDDL